VAASPAPAVATVGGAGVDLPRLVHRQRMQVV
jgi:hypothetical protein